VVAGPFALSRSLALHWRGMEDRRIREERARVEAEYRKVLKNSVDFEKRIRNRWREKNREKNRRIAESERRVAELEEKLERGS
jgi:serine phosphatase RsbU (regulator of sigma subunit)